MAKDVITQLAEEGPRMDPVEAWHREDQHIDTELGRLRTVASTMKPGSKKRRAVELAIANIGVVRSTVFEAYTILRQRREALLAEAAKNHPPVDPDVSARWAPKRWKTLAGRRRQQIEALQDQVRQVNRAAVSRVIAFEREHHQAFENARRTIREQRDEIERLKTELDEARGGY